MSNEPAHPFNPFLVLADEALLEETARLAAQEREATADLIAAIAEVDARRLYRQAGCSSTYTFCRQVLHLSEHAAFDRIAAARKARDFPVILHKLTDGSLTLSNLTLLAPHLKADTCEELLAAATHKSKHEVEAIVAALRPKPESTELYRLQLLISREAWEQLRRLQTLLLPSIGDGDPSRIVERALALMLTTIEKRKMAKVDHPRAANPPTPGSRTIPAAVKREVMERDEERCTYPGPDGRCTETRGLEFHHKKPFARGGLATAENIELRCRAHNQLEAEAEFGARAVHRTRPGASSAPGSKRAGESSDRGGRRRKKGAGGRSDTS